MAHARASTFINHPLSSLFRLFLVDMDMCGWECGDCCCCSRGACQGPRRQTNAAFLLAHSLVSVVTDGHDIKIATLLIE